MILSDLLDELRNNILFDRDNTVDGSDSDLLWSDVTLIRYINEAQRRFARRGLVIRDGTTAEVCRVTLVSGQTDYILHPTILSVLSARNSDSKADLGRFGHNEVSGFTNPSTLLWDPGAMRWPAGRALAFSTDEYLSEDDDGTITTVTMKVYPTPDSTNNGAMINLRVIRMPLDELTVNNLSAVPEIPVDHHLDMLDWAAYLALRIMDVDAGNTLRSDKFAESFEIHVKEARNLILQKMFAPQRWAFGRGGWSWGASNGW